MKKVIFAFIIIPATIVALILTLRFTHLGWEAKLVNPGFNPLEVAQKSEPIPSSTPNISVPKGYTFDTSTDLKAELEKVDPKVLDSDFK